MALPQQSQNLEGLVWQLNDAHAGLDATTVVESVLTDGPLKGEIALVSSFGAESALMLHMVARVDPSTPVVFLETGKHFAETLDYRDGLIEQFGLSDVRSIHPELRTLNKYDPEGSLHEADPDMCCFIRKVTPLDDAMRPFDAWFTGRKRYQSETRAKLPHFELEAATGRIKVNPLAGWGPEDVEAYRAQHDLPPHPLVARNYPSIGCAPCTRPVKPGEDPRAGRWAGMGKTECGIHVR
ncbi:MAG: phosphoadenylyl-sulfate reductase [Pseudomonadota bacterium]